MADSKFKPVGLLGITDEGKYVFVTIESDSVGGGVVDEAGEEEPGDGDIVDASTPSEVKVDREEKQDLSLGGRIEKHHEVSKEPV